MIINELLKIKYETQKRLNKAAQSSLKKYIEKPPNSSLNSGSIRLSAACRKSRMVFTVCPIGRHNRI